MTIHPTHTIWFACWVILVALVVPFAQIRAADDAPTAEAAPATDTPATSPAERIEQIRGRTQAAVATARGDRAQLVAAYKARREELAALANEAEAMDPSKLTAADHRALADVYSRDLQRSDEAARHAQAVLAAEPADLQAWTILVNAQASNRNTLNDAEASLAKAAQLLTPEQVAPLHAAIATWQVRGRQHRAAADHLATFLELGRGQLLGQGHPAGSYVNRVEQAVATYGSAKADDVALTLIERELAVLGTDEARQRGLSSPQVLAELTAMKIRQLVRMGQADAGRALLDESLRNARSAYDAAPEDAAALQALLPFARLEWEQSSASAAPADASGGAEPALYLQLLGKALQDNKLDAAVRRATAEAALAAGMQLLADDQYAEAGAIAKLLGETFVPDAEPPAAAAAGRLPIDPLQNQVRSFIRRVASEQARMALIGQPAFPLETDAWVNGDPLTDEDLKGKIVLLDFWAVWCGPCIACFPHLRQWHEKYADRGLVIIGLTKYYKYGWDAAAGRGTKVDGITPEEERAALVQFAAHHQLKHRLAYMPEGATLSERYGVTGIPQMVLIDREGKVRMIRVGSGEANAHDLEALIEELLASPANSLGDGNETETAATAENTP